MANFFAFLIAAVLWILVAFVATWLLTLNVPLVVEEPDHFWGWLGIVVAGSIVVGLAANSDRS